MTHSNSKRIYLIAGEASGDLHGSNLMKELKRSDYELEFRFWGGDLMQKEGGFLVSHYKDRAVMGIFEVLKNIRKFKKWIADCKEDILSFKPDILVLIDYGGFNLRIAEFAKNQGIRVHYYIPPKVWAWNEKRVHKIRKYTDQVYVILPFEKKYYTRHGVNCEYIGSPVADEISSSGITPLPEQERKADLIALLPGSRRQEIKYILPVMLRYAQANPDKKFQLPAADSIVDLIRSYDIPQNVSIVQGSTYSVLSKSYAAVVTSGTASLETALLYTPQVVVYKTGVLTYILGKIFIKVKHLSPVNLIAGKEVVRELLQFRCNPRSIQREIEKITTGSHRALVLAAYKKIKDEIGDPGGSGKVAESILRDLA